MNIYQMHSIFYSYESREKFHKYLKSRSNNTLTKYNELIMNTITKTVSKYHHKFVFFASYNNANCEENNNN